MVQIGSDFRNFQPFLYPLITRLQLQLERRVGSIYRPTWCAESIGALGFVICPLVVELWLESAPIFAIFDLFTYGNLAYFSGILLSPRPFGRHQWHSVMPGPFGPHRWRSVIPARLTDIDGTIGQHRWHSVISLPVWPASMALLFNIDGILLSPANLVGIDGILLFLRQFGRYAWKSARFRHSHTFLKIIRE